MRCLNCGGEIKPEDIYCNHCGMELSGRKNKSRERKRRSIPDKGAYKPLQNKFMRGEYQEHQEEQYPDDHYYNPQEAYDYGDYPDEFYGEQAEVDGGKNSIWGTLILFLVLALVVGFVVGLLIFTSGSQNILSIGV